ncbi:MAG: hypothetical protein IT158_11180 [Bryobacterales bacterium]|nr:hypothetical protein [Bryobacterales bacterium]
MEGAGWKLKRARERLNLRYRDVEDASLRIAGRHNNAQFAIALSRLADIENKGILPTIYRLYSLCAIYRLDLMEVLEWYGIDLSGLPSDAASIEIECSHVIRFAPRGEIRLPVAVDSGIDLRKSTFLSHTIRRWGKLPASLLDSLDLKNHRYAFIGCEDWTMYPLIEPGSFVLIDENRRKIANSGWSSEFDRPIYFFEHRQGYACGWCTLAGSQLVLQPHPASHCLPQVFSYPAQIDVIGQVTGVAMRLGPGKRRRPRP